MVAEGELLWTPSPQRIAAAHITAYQQWLRDERGLTFDSYEALWQWSVDELEAFWQSIWDYFEVQSSAPYECVLKERVMPGAQWFAGARLNFGEHILRKATPGKTAIYHSSEIAPLAQMSWDEVASQTRSLATALRNMGVVPGDRVVSYIPNIPHSAIGLYACASIGAIWSSCSPDFGTKSVLDRFEQIEPKVLITVDGYRFGGKDQDRRDEVASIVAALPSLERVIYISHLFRNDPTPELDKAVAWDELVTGQDPGADEFKFEQVDFDHPLWIVFSSGTTGLPKPIVHGHGGIVLETLKGVSFHFNLGPDANVFLYTSTGWIVWNVLVGSLLTGCSIVQYDGNPLYPAADTLWRVAEESAATFFGSSPTFIQIMVQHQIVPKDRFDLSRIEGIFVTGSPMMPETMAWCYENVREDLWVGSQCGGTDIAAGFIGAVPTLPVHAGEIQARLLGCDIHSYNEAGEPIIGEVGELVCRQPIPSMPLYFWNDTDNQRYLDSYFRDFPGTWRHGDFQKINERGGCYIYGRSDSTLNRYGVRIGTAEVYRAVEGLSEIEDSLVVNLNLSDGGFFMPLFVALRDGLTLDDPLRKKICDKIRLDFSPRHVPDKIYQVQEIPYTLTRKKMEIPVRKILSGLLMEKTASRDAMANPQAIEFFIEFAKESQDYRV